MEGGVVVKRNVEVIDFEGIEILTYPDKVKIIHPGSRFVSKYPAGEAILGGDFVYIKDDGIGGLEVIKAFAGVGGNPSRGFALGNYSIGEIVTVYHGGVNSMLIGITPNTRYYLSDTIPGKHTDIPVTGSGKIHQFLGDGVKDDSIFAQLMDYLILA